MIGYVTLGTNDLVKAAVFYDAIAAELETPRMMEFDTFIAWGKPGGVAGIGLTKPFDGNAASVGNGVMVALQAKDKDQVQRLYDIALANGGTCEGPPGPRGEGFYAGYFRDPDGNKLNAFIMEHVESAYHPCGTCRMGAADDPMAVVDPEARVIGVEGLRLADSSVFPRVTNGNLNAPSIMTGEKAADHILGRTPLAAANLEPWINPNWRTAQR